MKRVVHLKRKFLYKLFSDKSGVPHMKEYIYIFTRQDMSPEQQLVQSAHATLVLGHKLKDRKDASQFYFTVIGVPNLMALAHVMQDLEKMDRQFITFYEPDQGNTLTSIATYPIPEAERGRLKDYKLLRFTK
jgi:hypothetical protein